MDFERQTNRTLHDEHLAVIDLMAKAEQVLVRHARSPWSGDRLASDAGEVPGLLRRLASALASEVERHFAFEERDLFPLLEDAGEGDLVELLLEEHASVREAVGALAPLLAAAGERPLDEAEWRRVRQHGLEVCERLSSHAQKEEVSMLPALEDAIAPGQDIALWESYNAG